MYEAELLPEAQRHLNRLSPAVREATLEAIHGPIADNPRHVGKPLRDELEGLWCARRDMYRIVYEIVEGDRLVLVHRVKHRRDVYR